MSEKDDKLNKGSFLYIGDQNKAEWGVPEGYPDGNKPIDPSFLPSATLTTLGAVKQAVSVPDGSDINTLLAALREAGIITPLDQST